MDEQNISQNPAAEKKEVEPEKKFESLYAQVQGMSISEKVKLASLGNKEARNLLIKDANKLIQHAVINSPKITEEEIIGHAGNRNLSKEIPRMIAAKKEFIKNYRVKLALVNNAKTPVPTSLKLLRLLMEKDLRKIAKSKNVSSIIARTAQKTLSSKGRM
ncbi:MAG: hypothetical protein JRJ20_12735 [Deltaproteobacteria bacterium]|nr:hypothetical protein [Deltaproteobacteria bacterium]